MADLSEAQAALQVKIIGSDATGTETNEVNATVNGLQVDIQASVLPTGASTSNLQTTGNISLGSIDSKIITLANQIQIRDVINVSGQYRAQSVTTTASEALGAATILLNRKFISITPTNGVIYWGLSSAVTIATGTPILKNQTTTISSTDNVHIYVIAIATTDVRIVEGS